MLTPTRARLRKAIKVTYQALKPWGYKLHTNEKTYIGKIAKGFDFCGFRLSYDKLILAKSCLAKFEKRLCELCMCDYQKVCLLYTSPSPRDRQKSRMPSSA